MGDMSIYNNKNRYTLEKRKRKEDMILIKRSFLATYSGYISCYRLCEPFCFGKNIFLVLLF